MTQEEINYMTQKEEKELLVKKLINPIIRDSNAAFWLSSISSIFFSVAIFCPLRYIIVGVSAGIAVFLLAVYFMYKSRKKTNYLKKLLIKYKIMSY
ncbi:MAG: NrfD/PsrC family molybdoenzyme membrane anchor subunit [Candidatus Absconditabacterales bacterium]|jgi:hypothetical protein